MNCQEFETRIPEYLDGVADGFVIRVMDEHRNACKDCSFLLKLHEQVLLALNETEPVSAPEGLADRILAAAAAEEAVTQPSIVPRWASALFAAAVLFVAGAFLRLGSFITQTTGAGDGVSGFSLNWIMLLEWPLLLKAWLLGFLARPWVQTLLEPVYFDTFGLSVPIFFFAAYLLVLGITAYVTVRFFKSPLTVSGER